MYKYDIFLHSTKVWLPRFVKITELITYLADECVHVMSERVRRYENFNLYFVLSSDQNYSQFGRQKQDMNLWA